jgi:hypothetical protein
MNYLINLNDFAQTYGACDYGGSTSQTGSCGSAASNSYGGTTSTSGGATLTDTGFDILLIVSVACVLMFIAMVVRIWRRPKKQAPTTTPPPQFPTN